MPSPDIVVGNDNKKNVYRMPVTGDTIYDRPEAAALAENGVSWNHFRGPRQAGFSGVVGGGMLQVFGLIAVRTGPSCGSCGWTKRASRAGRGNGGVGWRG